MCLISQHAGRELLAVQVTPRLYTRALGRDSRIPEFDILPNLKPETSSLNIKVIRSGIKAIVKEAQVVQDARSNIEIIHNIFQRMSPRNLEATLKSAEQNSSEITITLYNSTLK